MSALALRPRTGTSRWQRRRRQELAGTPAGHEAPAGPVRFGARESAVRRRGAVKVTIAQGACAGERGMRGQQEVQSGAHESALRGRGAVRCAWERGARVRCRASAMAQGACAVRCARERCAVRDSQPVRSGARESAVQRRDPVR